MLSACAPGTQTPTPLIALDSGQQVQFETSAPTSTPLPLHFDLPTPGAEPVLGPASTTVPRPLVSSQYDHFYFARPIGANNVNWPLAQYRYGGIFFDSVVHTGVDIPDEKGTPNSGCSAGDGRLGWLGAVHRSAA